VNRWLPPHYYAIELVIFRLEPPLRYISHTAIYATLLVDTHITTLRHYADIYEDICRQRHIRHAITENIIRPRRCHDAATDIIIFDTKRCHYELAYAAGYAIAATISHIY